MSDLVERLNEEGLGFGIGPALLCQEAAAEITRLRAALADAHAIGFSAGVEAAAKVAGEHAADLLDKAEFYQPPRTNADQYLSGIHEQASASVHQVATAIRALTPPDLTAAAARVLLGDDIQIACMAAAVHDGPLGADDHWFSAATKQGAWCVDVVRSALRAIAGDTK